MRFTKEFVGEVCKRSKAALFTAREICPSISTYVPHSKMAMVTVGYSNGWPADPVDLSTISTLSGAR